MSSLEHKMHFANAQLLAAQGWPTNSQGKSMEQAELLRDTSSRSQRGMSILETIVGLLVLTIVMVTAGQLLRVQVLHLALSERARLADTQANNALNQFAAYNQSALPD